MPTTATLFLDCDDCIYQNDWATAKKITVSIAAYAAKLGVGPEKAYALYKMHGTCLKGMLAENIIKPEEAENFLKTVHEIDYSDIAADPLLVEILGRLTVPTWVFTASTSEHAQRCMTAVGLAELAEQRFKGIVDTRTCKLETKHSPASFQAAMAAAGTTDPASCTLCDDSVKNIVAAKKLGWRTVLVGLKDRDTGAPIDCPQADSLIPSLHHLPEVLPELFGDADSTGAPDGESYPPELEQLVEMGFERESARAAIAQAKGDVMAASTILAALPPSA